MGTERTVTFRPRTIITVALLLVGVAIVLWVIWVSRRVLVWTFVSVFLAIAMSPGVDALQRRGVRRRGLAAGLMYVIVLAIVAGIGALILPTLIQQVNDLVRAAPGYVRDLTAGRGPLGFLETKYHVVERVQEAVRGNGSGRLAGGATAALDVTRSVITFVAGVVTIAFMTFFMLLEGPAWRDRLIALLPAPSQPRAHHIAHEVSRTVGGYVTGNLLISLIAGFATTMVLLTVGVPFALALGLLVAILDLIPLAGATLAAIIVTLVSLTESVTAALIVFAYFVVYQQVENHLLQPVVYGRTVQLSPLAILISVLIGAEVAGVIGALGAIPVAGTIQIVLVDWIRHRRARADGDGDADALPRLHARRYADGHRDGHGDRDADADGDRHRNGHADCHRDGHAMPHHLHAHSNGHSNADVYAHPNGESDAGGAAGPAHQHRHADGGQCVRRDD
jgi:predicted PurR-regulated permease PerM